MNLLWYEKLLLMRLWVWNAYLVLLWNRALAYPRALLPSGGPLSREFWQLTIPLTLYVNSNYISNVHVIFIAMCVLTVRHYIMVRGLTKSLQQCLSIWELNIRVLITLVWQWNRNDEVFWIAYILALTMVCLIAFFWQRNMEDSMFNILA